MSAVVGTMIDWRSPLKSQYMVIINTLNTCILRSLLRLYITL
ncbi:MAG: hypothetical protein RMZ69_27790 [Nostoc sp. ChiQUE01a]|nr:hypothetical protein [Nostoc sp. ChiQUE01a]